MDHLRKSSKKKSTLLRKSQILLDSARNSLLVFSENLPMTTSASILGRRPLSQAISKITKKLRTTRLILTRLCKFSASYKTLKTSLETSPFLTRAQPVCPPVPSLASSSVASLASVLSPDLSTTLSQKEEMTKTEITQLDNLEEASSVGLKFQKLKKLFKWEKTEIEFEICCFVTLPAKL